MSIQFLLIWTVRRIQVDQLSFMAAVAKIFNVIASVKSLTPKTVSHGLILVH